MLASAFIDKPLTFMFVYVDLQTPSLMSQLISTKNIQIGWTASNVTELLELSSMKCTQ